MGVYNVNGRNSIEQELQNPDELLETYIYDELSHMDDEDKAIFGETAEYKALEEAGLINKKTLVRLNKNDDITRRTTMASFQLAKEADDPLWNKLVKNRVIERELIGKINTKYGNKAERIAKTGQKTYLKSKMPSTLIRKSQLSSSK